MVLYAAYAPIIKQNESRHAFIFSVTQRGCSHGDSYALYQGHGIGRGRETGGPVSAFAAHA